ncbi:MAG: glucose-6-phosphate dehydrogenase assembly protein OpcA [Actinomycetia bacterium]|nr:glucose-6-phosphate dehydrogenase assembly protein OpcA [Actinomycetes bacterium]
MIRLEDTNGSAVAAEIAAERHRMGSPATGMVLNLLVLTDEENQADATAVAAFSAQEHPMRILVLIPRRGRVKPRLDAEISVGGDEGPGEIAVLRLHGELSQHPGSVAIPLLLSDTPVVSYWPTDAPDVPHENTIGAHAQRRITDATASARQMQALNKRVKGYFPGDTDLAWTMTTAWRTLLAATLDQPHPPIIGAEVSLPKTHASGHLLASWLGSRLKVPASVVNSKGPGITSVRLITPEGDIAIARPDGSTARLSRPGLPPATIALPRRSRADALTEELRRLDPDEIYGEALAGLNAVKQGRLKIDRPGTPITKKSKKRSSKNKKSGAKK